VTDTFAQNLVHFSRLLRAVGLGVIPRTSQDLIAAATSVGLGDRQDVYHAFKAVSVVRSTEIPIFDEAFDLFFGSRRALLADVQGAWDVPQRHGSEITTLPVIRAAGMADSLDDAGDLSDIVGGSHTERLASRDFADMTPLEREEVRRMISRVMWRAADAASRRWRPSTAGLRPDLRRTFRGLLGPEGDLMPLSLIERRRRKRPLVVLADISGSMERYTEMFLHFIHAAQGRLGRVEAFVFATRLTHISREMRQRDTQAALGRVAEAVEDWSGGTRIGDALEQFNRVWSRRVTRGGAIGLIISDGWDTGEPDLLEQQMARFSRSMHRAVWLNPLAGREGYAPETRGMRTVLPYIDDFLPAASLVDLKGVIRLLESVPTHRRSAVKV
jgi:uncharacterized protein with von Willebrand factor type A (vWA) domain